MARSKKPPNYHRGEPGPWGKVFKVLGVLALVAVILTGAWALTLLEPRRVNWDDPALQPSGPIPKEVSALLDQSRLLESKFHDTEKLGEVTPDDLKNLSEAIRLQVEYLDKTQNHGLGEANERIASMTASLQTYESLTLHQQSVDLELHATDLEDKNDLAGAKTLLEQAAKLEDQIIHDYSKGQYYTTASSRSAALHRHVDRLTALPLNNESRTAETTAKAALASQDWQTALDNFKRAYDLQLRLNREFPQQPFTNDGRLQSLDQEMTALRSLPQHQKIDQLLKDGHAADEAANFPKAAELYQEAQRQQRDLIANFPSSRFADTAIIDSVETLRQTALSRTLAAEIKSQAATVFADLRNRHPQPAHDTIAVLAQKTARFHDTFPRSKLLDGELQQSLDFLNFKRDALAGIQEQVYGELLAIPLEKHYLLEKQEVSQALYAAVSGGTPTSSQLPANQVNWNDAQQFCHRLSWILARPVRLPNVDEYKAALGPADSLDFAAMTWNLDNSKGQAQAVATKAANANGFYDLLGNIAEWLDRPGDMDNDQALVIGGSAQTPVDALRKIPVATVASDNRNALTGFRFVVNTDDSVPLLPDAPADLPTDKTETTASKP